MPKMEAIRRRAQDEGKQVGWDADTGNVTIGSDEYTEQDLRDKGAEMRDGRWHAPEGAIVGGSSQPVDDTTDEMTDNTQIPYEETSPPEINIDADEVPAPPTQEFESNIDSEAEIEEMMGMIDEQADMHFEEQQSQLEQMKNNQIRELDKAYSQAVQDGEISMREAEQQFEEQKEQVERKAYEDQQKTSLHAQEAGIQHSPQMVGMMQGDQARTRNQLQDARSDRDQRLNDVRDRLSRVREQKQLDIAGAHEDYEQGLVQAQSQANQMRAEQSYDLARGDFEARREQDMQQQQMAQQHNLNMQGTQYQQQLQRQQMADQHGMDLARDGYQADLQAERDDRQFKQALDQATHQSKLNIREMGAQHEFREDEIEKMLETDLRKMEEQHGYDMQMQSQQHQQRLTEISSQGAQQLNQIQERHEQERELMKDKLDPNSEIGQLRLEQKEREDAQEVENYFDEIAMQATTEAFYDEEARDKLPMDKGQSYIDQQRSDLIEAGSDPGTTERYNPHTGEHETFAYGGGTTGSSLTQEDREYIEAMERILRGRDELSDDPNEFIDNFVSGGQQDTGSTHPAR